MTAMNATTMMQATGTTPSTIAKVLSVVESVVGEVLLVVESVMGGGGAVTGERGTCGFYFYVVMAIHVTNNMVSHMIHPHPQPPQ